jgi:hypothetical protein
VASLLLLIQALKTYLRSISAILAAPDIRIAMRISSASARTCREAQGGFRALPIAQKSQWS